MFGLNTQQFATVLIVFFYAVSYGFVWLYNNVLLHRLPANQQARLKEIVIDSVKAAQYVGSNNTVQDAIKRAEDLCRQFKITFDLTTVTHLVHAASQELKMIAPATTPIVNAVDDG